MYFQFLSYSTLVNYVVCLGLCHFSVTALLLPANLDKQWAETKLVSDFSVIKKIIAIQYESHQKSNRPPLGHILGLFTWCVSYYL